MYITIMGVGPQKDHPYYGFGCLLPEYWETLGSNYIQEP